MNNFSSKIDMHMHSIASDGLSDAKTIVKKAKKLGISIAITDHNAISQSLAASKNKMGVTVIPGIEVTCKEGPHILFYFYSFRDLTNFFEKRIKPNYNKAFTSNLNIGMSDLMQASNKLNGLTIAAHPFSPGLCGSYISFSKNDEFIKNVIAIEGINSSMTDYANEKAILWAKQIKKPLTDGSDADHTRYIRLAYTPVDPNRNADNILDSIKKGNCTIGGRIMRLHEKLWDSKNIIKTWASSPTYFLSKGIKDIIKSRKLRKLNKC